MIKWVDVEEVEDDEVEEVRVGLFRTLSQYEERMRDVYDLAPEEIYTLG